MSVSSGSSCQVRASVYSYSQNHCLPMTFMYCASSSLSGMVHTAVFEERARTMSQATMRVGRT